MARSRLLTKNPRRISIRFVFTKLVTKSRQRNHTQNRYLQYENHNT